MQLPEWGWGRTEETGKAESKESSKKGQEEEGDQQTLVPHSNLLLDFLMKKQAIAIFRMPLGCIGQSISTLRKLRFLFTYLLCQRGMPVEASPSITGLRDLTLPSGTAAGFYPAEPSHRPPGKHFKDTIYDKIAPKDKVTVEKSQEVRDNKKRYDVSMPAWTHRPVSRQNEPQAQTPWRIHILESTGNLRVKRPP